jgi:hypothetical protein
MSTTVSPAQKVTVLKHLINDRNTEFIEAATGLTRDQVNDVKRDHGYPDVDKMKWALDILAKQGDALPAATTAAIRPAPTPGRPAPAVTGTEANNYVRTLDAAKASNKARTRNLGLKITNLLAQLERAIADETRERKAAAAKAREDAEKKARIATLEAELAALKGKTTTKSTPTGDGPPASEIRSWARTAGVECPAKGRVPAAVREAYDAARAESDAA